MADRSKIEWTDASWTPIRATRINGLARVGHFGWHCEHVSEGCRNCYAESMNKRLGTGLLFRAQDRKDVALFLDEEMLFTPLGWRKPRMIFVCSMSDLFADFVKQEWITRLFAIMALCPQHTFQVLTKRPDRMRKYMTRGLARNEVELAAEIMRPSKGNPFSPKWRFKWPLSNVWLGVSAEAQQEADERIPLLLRTPAAVRFVSLEPLLGPIDLTRLCILPQRPGSVRAGIHVDALRGRYCESGVVYKGDWDIAKPPPRDSERRQLDWVIVGGESGSNARPMHPRWARDLRDQCQAADVPFFFKQWGEYRPADQIPIGKIPNHAFIVKWPDAPGMVRVGKKAAGSLLDGIEHNAFPLNQREPANTSGESPQADAGLVKEAESTPVA